MRNHSWKILLLGQSMRPLPPVHLYHRLFQWLAVFNKYFYSKNKNKHSLVTFVLNNSVLGKFCVDVSSSIWYFCKSFSKESLNICVCLYIFWCSQFSRCHEIIGCSHEEGWQCNQVRTKQDDELRQPQVIQTLGGLTAITYCSSRMNDTCLVHLLNVCLLIQQDYERCVVSRQCEQLYKINCAWFLCKNDTTGCYLEELNTMTTCVYH